MRHLILPTIALTLVSMIWLSPLPSVTYSGTTQINIANPAAPLAVCFAEGTDPDYMAEWTHRIIDRVGALDYNLSGRWNNTANGTTGSQGTGVTLTYSFVPDGVSIDGDPSVLFSRMNELFPNQQTWQGLFAQMFARWAEVTGNTYVQVADDGAGWADWSPGELGERGDIRIAMTPMDGGSGVLAYNFFPDRGDMVLDEDEDWNSGANNYRFLRNIVAHEHGHGLGLAHVCPINTTKLLEPTYTPAFDGPQHDDILAGQRGYGDPFEPNDELGAAYDLGQIEGVRVVQLVSLDDNTDIDWWQFSILPNRSLTITVAPDGRQYLEGNQNNDGSCEAGSTYNTFDDQNLNFTLTTASGTELVTVADRPIGNSEEVFRFDVPQGQTSLRLLVDGATNNAIQPYKLTIESIDPATPYLMGCPLEIDTTLQGQPAASAIILNNPPHGDELTISSMTITGPFSVETVTPTILEPSGELVITVTFNADSLGWQTGELTINHSGPGGSLTCEVTAFAASSSLSLFTGATTNFGDVRIGTQDSALVGLRSEGNVPLTIHSVSTQAPFSVTFNGPVLLQPGPLLRILPRVFPTALGEQHGWLIINHSAATSPDSVELVVNGTPNLDANPDAGLPTEFALYQNYPNPFNPTTNIAFDLPQSSNVSLKLYNLQGQLVRKLLTGQEVSAGRHTVELVATGLATGVYIYRIEAANFTADRKLLLLK